jgi:hypothetical protein
MAISIAARTAATTGRRHRNSASNQKRRQEPEARHKFAEFFHYNSPFLKFLNLLNTLYRRVIFRSGEPGVTDRNLTNP